MKEIGQPLMGGGGGVIKINLSVVAKEHFITINEIVLLKWFCATCHLSQINKPFILSQPFNQL